MTVPPKYHHCFCYGPLYTKGENGEVSSSQQVNRELYHQGINRLCIYLLLDMVYWFILLNILIEESFAPLNLVFNSTKCIEYLRYCADNSNYFF